MWILKFLFTRNRVLQHKVVDSNLHVCCNGLGKCELHTFFTFLQRILTSTHENFNFFCIIYVAMSNIHYSDHDNVKMTCITQVSFEITIRKRHVYIDILWPWKWNQYFYLGIWEDERSKIIFLLSFQLVTRLNSQNRNETSLLWTLTH